MQNHRCSMERIHPESYQTLRQLIKLHGAERLRTAIREIEKKEEKENIRGKAILNVKPHL